MKKLIYLACITASFLLVSCAATKVMTTWKAPDYQGGPVHQVAVLAVDERGLVRQGFENRFVKQLRATSQGALVTHDLLSLPEIKADKNAAVSRVRQAGADTVLIVRLVDGYTTTRQVAATTPQYVEVVTGTGSTGWYDYYTVAYTDMATVWGSTTQTACLETSLYDLSTNRRLWSCVTETVLKDGLDKLTEADLLVTKVLTAMRKDGVVR